MKNLMYKEFRLNINPGLLLFLTLVFLFFIPSWVFFIALSYIYFFFMVLGAMDKVNQDLTFACSLPVPKSSIVSVRTTTVVIIEVVNLVIAGAVSFARYYWLDLGGNQAGMNTNLAFFGFMLMMYAIFNLIFLPGSYKRAYRMLWPILGGSLIAVVFGGVVTSVIAFQPDLARIFNDRGLGHPAAQITVFVAGLLVYAGLTLLARHKAVSNFAKVDL